MVGTNLGILKGRRKTPSDKEYVVQLREGERGNFEVVSGRKNKEGDIQIMEDV